MQEIVTEQKEIGYAGNSKTMQEIVRAEIVKLCRK